MIGCWIVLCLPLPLSLFIQLVITMMRCLGMPTLKEVHHFV